MLLALTFFIYPAVTIGLLMVDSELKATGQSRFVPRWFEAAAGRYGSWATWYLDTNYATSLDHNDVARTEWPMFGSVLFLVTADELQLQGKIDVSQVPVQEAINKAVQVVVSPVTATWVKAKWGNNYLEVENIFYRMLLLLGLVSYESITGDQTYRSVMSIQRESLANELMEAHLFLKDDYPGECYPNDVLWAVAAIQRAALLEGKDHADLARNLMRTFDGQVRTQEGLPAFQMDSKIGAQLQGARGCGNSGILQFAAELDPEVAFRWYEAYDAGYWKDIGWLVGFTELPIGSKRSLSDIDSGPVLFEFGSVASAFGIGAAKSVGRMDHAVPLTMEAIACSWPTPFGFLIPALMGQLAVESKSLGEIALLFSMTRPTYVEDTIPFTGPIPWIVWAFVILYAGIGLLWISRGVRYIRRAMRNCSHL